MKTALIKGQSRYGSMRYFVDELAQAIEARGDEVVILDTIGFSETELGERLKAAAPLDLVLSFNIYSNYRDAAGRSIFTITGAPHVTHFVDHPLHHLERLRGTPREAAVLFVDQSHVRDITKLFGPGRFSYVGFCPHGALGQPAPMLAGAREYCAQRPIQVLFTGSCYRPSLATLEQCPEHVKAVFVSAIEAAKARHWLPALDALDGALAAYGVPMHSTDPEILESIATLRGLGGIVDDWVRSFRRMHLLEQAIRSGLELTIVGEGYEDFPRRPNVDIRGPLATEEIPALMRQSRIVLNANANFGEGSHERALTAMLAGAVVATDASTFYDAEFKDGSEIVAFRWPSLDAGLTRIKDLAADQDALFEIAKAGHAAVAARHRWQHRVDNYYDAARTAAAACRQP